eukprot:PLAT3482.1.p2 GENE.PLAT3482.1~~PLAT3482.1.p2  ORF type:complete len:471 (-),score=287.29 PLAT3482.1:289-1701(-)
MTRVLAFCLFLLLACLAAHAEKTVTVEVDAMGDAVDGDASANESPLDRFTMWLHTHGTVFNNVELRMEEESGFPRFYATGELKRGESPVELPVAVAMTAETAAESPVGALVATMNEAGLGQSHAVMLQLLYERFYNKDSFWAPYLDLLPSRLSNIYDMTEEEQDEVLEGTHVSASARQKLSQLRFSQQHLLEMAANDDLFDACPDRRTWEAQVRWAHATLLAHGTSGRDGEPLTHVLLPGADMMQHSSLAAPAQAVTDEADGSTLGWLMPVAGAFSAGDALTANYYVACNDEALLQLGRLSDSHFEDCVTLPISLQTLSPRERRVVAGRSDAVQLDRPLRPGQPLSDKLFTALRLIVLYAADDDDADDDANPLLAPVDAKSECTVHVILQKQLEEASEMAEVASDPMDELEDVEMDDDIDRPSMLPTINKMRLGRLDTLRELRKRVKRHWDDFAAKSDLVAADFECQLEG